MLVFPDVISLDDSMLGGAETDAIADLLAQINDSTPGLHAQEDGEEGQETQEGGLQVVRRAPGAILPSTSEDWNVY